PSADFTGTATVSVANGAYTDAAGNAGTGDSDSVAVDTGLPVPTISLADDITADDIINAVEATQTIAITGTVGGDAKLGDTVTLTVNGKTFPGLVVDNAGTLGFSIDVPGADLAADTSITASVSTTDTAGNVGTASDTEGYSVDTTPAATPTAVTGTEDTAITLSWANFGITDIDSADSDLSVIITQLPAAGSLHFEQAPGSWVAVTLNQQISHVDIAAGKLRFEPVANESGSDAYGSNGVGDQQADYAQVKFKPTDGVNEGNEATLVIDITPVADAPTLNLAGSSVLAAADFENVALNGANHSGAIQASSLNNGLGGVWQTDNSDGQIEIGQESVYIGGSSTNQVIELERNAGDASNLYTEITGTAGSTYSLDFDYSPRGGDLDNSTIEVFWGGNLIDTLSAGTVGFTSHHYDLPILTDGTYKLEFKALDNNSTGGLLDNIVLSAVHNVGNEDTSIRLSGITAELMDTDDSETLQVSIGNIPSGAILTDNSGNSFEASDDNGNLVDITDWDKSTLSILPPPNFNGTIALNVIATATETANSDQSSTTSTLNVTVNPVNDAPVNTLPTNYTTNEDTTLKLSGLSVVDVDTASAAISVTLAVTRGAITATDASGVTVSGSGSDSVVLSGTLADINAYLANASSQPSYVPLLDDSGNVTLTMVSNDLGNTGAGGALIDTDTSIINIIPVADAVPASDVSVEIGTPQSYEITAANSSSELHNKSSHTLDNGIVVSTGSTSIFNWSNGNDLGIKQAINENGNSAQRIESNEAITFSFPVGMQYLALKLKNAKDDTIQIRSELDPGDLPVTQTITGTITATNGLTSDSNIKVALILQVTDANGNTTTSEPINADVTGGNWSIVYGPINGTITKASLVSLIDGDLYNNGGQDSVTFRTSVNMQSLSIAQDPSNTFTSGDLNNGFQIEYVAVNPGSNGQSYTYPIDFWAAVQDNVGEAEAFTSLVLSDFDLPPDAIISVRLNDGSYDEIAPNAQGEYDLSDYTNLLNSPTTPSGTDKVYLVTSSPLPSGFAPTLTLEVSDGGTSTAKTIIGGSASSTLTGGEGNDYIDGGAGNDILIGGEGDDILFGGAGADTFVWQAGDTGNDVIKDFNIGEGDRIDLRDLLQGEEAENAPDITQYLRVDTATSTLQISTTGGLDATGSNADVTVKLENGGNPVNINPGNLSQTDLISSLIAGSDPTIKIDHA
ncbi:MAG: Ig-like domain-containing protein, partial [Pseudomonas sp.]|uniref:Ig-like domain-containing protein n=1 Tax=Pseudomonas sp. TaxID=306 RepID=UPI003BB4CF99